MLAFGADFRGFLGEEHKRQLAACAPTISNEGILGLSIDNVISGQRALVKVLLLTWLQLATTIESCHKTNFERVKELVMKMNAK